MFTKLFLVSLCVFVCVCMSVFCLWVFFLLYSFESAWEACCMCLCLYWDKMAYVALSNRLFSLFAMLQMKALISFKVLIPANICYSLATEQWCIFIISKCDSKWWHLTMNSDLWRVSSLFPSDFCYYHSLNSPSISNVSKLFCFVPSYFNKHCLSFA